MNRNMKWVLGCVLLLASWTMAQDLAKPWALSVKTGVQATDNRDGSDANKENNVDFYVQPRGDLILRDGERSTLDLFVSPMAKVHSNPRNADEGDPQSAPQNDKELFGALGVDLMYQLTPRVKLNAGDTLIYNDDPAIDEGGVGKRESASHVLNIANAGLGLEVTPRVSLDVSGSSTIKRYTDDKVAENEDEDIWNAESRLGYLFGSGYKMFGVVGYSDFENESTTRARGSKVASVGVGLEKIFNPDVHGTLMGGYQSASYADDTLDDTDTANARAEMVFRAESATRFRVGASYGFYAPYVQPYSLQKLTSVQGSVEHDVLPQRLTVAVKAQYSDGEYEKEGEGDSLKGGSDELYTAGLSASYRIDRTWSVGAGYTYEKWDSEVRESFDRNYVDASVTAQF